MKPHLILSLLSSIYYISDVLYEGDIIKQPINGPGVPENQTIVEVGIDSLKYELSGENYQLRDGTPTSNLATLDLVRSETHQVPGGIAFATYARDTLGVVDVTVYTIEEMANSDMGLPEVMTDPDLAATDYAFETALWFFRKNKLFKIADEGVTDDTIKRISKRVNGGYHGLDDRMEQTKKIYEWLNAS